MNAPAARRIQISQPCTGEEEWQAARQPIMDGWLTQGPRVAEFERAFAELVGVEHAAASSNCTTALHLVLAALGIGPGDEVVVPSFTWVATANVVLYAGATPVFADVRRDTFNIDTDDLLRRITPRTRAVIVVHLFGLCVDVAQLRAALPAGIAIIEDAACAAGAAIGGISAGALGDAAAFSFHPRKSVTTGEGGMVTTRDAGLAERVRVLRNHGAAVSEEERHRGPKPYLLPSFNVMGFNYRMTDVQGAIGVAQLRKLPRLVAERAQWADWYARELADVPWLRLPALPTGSVHGWQSYVTYVDPARAPRPRNELMARLQELGVATRPGTHAIHMLDYYRDRFGLREDDLPGARDCDRHSMAIPLHNRMTPEDYAYVVESIKSLG
jgi:perosamine synthetase